MKSLLASFAFSFCLISTYAQQPIGIKPPSLLALAENKETKGESPLFTMDVSPKNNALGSILLSPSANVPMANAKQWISDRLQLRAGIDELRKKDIPSAYPQLTVERFGQYFKSRSLACSC